MNYKTLCKRKNKLLQYRNIMQEFEALQKKNKGAIITQLYKNFIYPKFFISKHTLYKIFNTDIEKELQEIEEQIKAYKNETLD